MFKNNFKNYIDNLNIALLSLVEENSILELYNHFKNSLNSANEIHIFGNGGSAANAYHIVGDFTKTLALYSQKLKISSISDNGCYLSAASNDLDFSEVFSFLIPNRISEKDSIIFLSGSGNSSNLVKCAYKAKKYGIKTIAITGFDGGKLKQIVDIPIHVPIHDMEIAEDTQLIIVHMIKQELCKYLAEKGFTPDCKVEKYNKRVSKGEVA